MSTGLLAVIVSLWIICACGTATIAARKGLSVGGYFLLGFLLGLIGLAIAMIAQPRPAGQTRHARPATSTDTKACIVTGCRIRVVPGALTCHRHAG